MKKITFLFALLCASVMSFAYITAPDTWIEGGGENDNFKWTEIDGITSPSDVVNIQKPGFASQTGIYITFADAAFNAVYYNGELKEINTDYAQQGAGLCFYLSSLTEKNTDVILKQDGTTRFGFHIYNDNGTDPDTRTNPNLTITSSTSLTLDPEETSTITYTTLSNGAISYSSSDNSIATVDGEGVITAVATGTATITVSQEGTVAYKPASKKVTVTVSFAKKPSNQGYGSLRLIDADLYDWNGDFAGSNACGKVDLFIVTYGNKIVYKAVIKDGKTFENCTNYFCQLRTWKPDFSGMIEQWALTCSEDLTSRTLLPTQTDNAPGLSIYGNDIKLTSYMVVSGGCGARTIQTVPYTRDYINNYDSSDETAPVLGAATVTPGVNDITVSFDEVTSEDVFYMIEDNEHYKRYYSLQPSFVLEKDGSGISYNYSCYAIDFNGNKSEPQIAVVEMPFSAVTNQALNRFHEAGYEPGNTGEISDKAIDGNEGTAWVTYPNRPASEEWIYVDLGEEYNLSGIEIVWGDNRSTKYILQTRSDAPSAEDKANDLAWTLLADTITDAEVNSTKTTGVSGHGRYVRFHSLARIGDCIRLKEMRVFATSIYDPDAGEDTENPVITAASLVSKTYNSAVISITASDDKGIIKINAADASKSYSKDIETDGTSSITLTDLSEKTSYTITLTAYDAMNKTSEPFVLDAFTTDADPTVPQEVAPTPTHSSSNVLPVYSNAYDSVLAHSFGFDNWGSVSGTEKNIGGDHFVVYDMSAGNWMAWGADGNGANAIVAKSGYHKESYTGLDASEMEFLHVDIWSQQAVTNKYIIYINDQGLKTLRLSHSGEGWQSYNIDLDEFEVATDDVKKSGNVRWMKFDGFDTTTSKIAIDNVYFYNNGTSTSIEDAQSNKVQCTKVLRDGVLYIMNNGTMYNVQGQKVK